MKSLQHLFKYQQSTLLQFNEVSTPLKEENLRMWSWEQHFVVKQDKPEFCMYRILSLPVLRQGAAQEEGHVWEQEHLRMPKIEKLE